MAVNNNIIDQDLNVIIFFRDYISRYIDNYNDNLNANANSNIKDHLINLINNFYERITENSDINVIMPNILNNSENTETPHENMYSILYESDPESKENSDYYNYSDLDFLKSDNEENYLYEVDSGSDSNDSLSNYDDKALGRLNKFIRKEWQLEEILIYKENDITFIHNSMGSHKLVNESKISSSLHIYSPFIKY